MAIMTAQNVIDKCRFFLNDDNSSAQRWLDDMLWPLVNDAVVKVTQVRPDSLYSSVNALITITPATSVASPLSIDDKWLIPCALFVAAMALNRQAGQTFNAQKAAAMMEQFSAMVKV